MIKRFIFAIIGFALLVAALVAVKAKQITDLKSQPREAPIMAVSSFDARSEQWRPNLSGIGSVAPVQGVSLSTETEGTVIKINFDNGHSVHAGDVLIELDTSLEAAQLKSAQAALVLAKLNSERSSELLKKNTISQSQLDEATAQLDQANANVQAIQAQIDKKIVKAPFDGRVGIRAVNIGQFVTRGQPLVTLQKLDQLYVNFTLPERDLPKLSAGQVVKVYVDAFPDRHFEGVVNAISPEVDSSTRNVSVQGVFENPDNVLRPGMYARVEVEMSQGENNVVVPSTAVAYAPYGNSVFIIEEMKGKDGAQYLGVRQQFVKLGDKRGDFVAVLDGVKPGEKVVSAGVFKLRNALPVQMNNVVLPEAELHPTPANT